MNDFPLLGRQHYSLQLLAFVGLTFASAIIFSMVGYALGGIIGGVNPILEPEVFADLTNPASLKAMKVIQLASAIGIFIVPPFIFASLVSSNKMEYLGFNLSFTNKAVMLVPLLMLAALPVINWMAEINGMLQLPEALAGVEKAMKVAEEKAAVITEAFLAMETRGDLLFNLLLIAVIPAVGEELLFRGVFQQLFSKWTNSAHWGVWIAAAIFSAIHGQFYGFIPRMVLGALLGYLLVWSGSLWLPILGHFVNNGAAVTIAYLIGRGTISEDIETVGSGEEQLIFVVTSILLVILFSWWIYKKERNRISNH